MLQDKVLHYHLEKELSFLSWLIYKKKNANFFQTVSPGKRAAAGIT